MRKQLSAYINTAITGILLVTVGLLPLIFTQYTTEFYEIPKLIFLTVVVVVLLTLWAVSWVLQGRVLITKTPLDIALLLLLVITLLSAAFGASKYISIYGSFPRVHGSAASWVAYILFYFIATSHLKTAGQIKTMLYALLISTGVIGFISLASYFGLFLPLAFAKVANFSPAGSSFSTAALIVLLLPLLLISVVKPGRLIPQPAAIAISTLFGVVLALISGLATGVAAIIAIILVFAVTKNEPGVKKNLPMLAIPILVSVVILVISFIPLGDKNILQQKRLNFPREIQLPFSTSWKVSASAFRDAPFLGTGPSTYAFNFTTYKPLDFNSSRFWNLRFDTSFNEFFQVLGTLGGLGFLALVLLSAVILSFGWKGMAHGDMMAKALSISAVLVVILLALHTSTVVSIVTSLVILAMLMGIHKTITGKVEDLSLSIKASKITDTNLIIGDILPIILLIPILLFVVFAFWNIMTTALADYNHRMALNSASKNGLATYNHLIQAEKYNKYIDLYRSDLAQTNFALANAIAASKGPTEASPGGSLTDEDKKNIQQLLSQSINEARVAVALSPRSAQNWEILASIYRQIAGVAQNALAFSLDSYGRAIQNDPLNPLLRLNVGGVYYSAKNYDLAIRFFTDAINLKPDYANAYYNLSVALRDKGDLRSSQASAERVMALVDPKSNDYKVASEFLSDLKAKAATDPANVAGVSSQIPPAAQTNSSLDKQGLPEVVDLGNQPNVATPSAVKPNPQTPKITPSATPIPSVSPES